MEPVNHKIIISHTLGIVSIRHRKRNTYNISLGRITAKMLGIYDIYTDKLTFLIYKDKPCIKYASFDENKSYRLFLDNSLIFSTFTLDYHFIDGLYTLENLGNDIFEIVLLNDNESH